MEFGLEGLIAAAAAVAGPCAAIEFVETLRAPEDAAKEEEPTILVPLTTRLGPPVETLLGRPGRWVAVGFASNDVEPENIAGLERDSVIVPVEPTVENVVSSCIVAFVSFTEPKLRGDVLVAATLVIVWTTPPGCC